MNSNSEIFVNEEENFLSLIIDSGKHSHNPTLQRYYFSLINYEQKPLECTDFLFNIILNTNNNSKFIKLNENEQKSFVIYFKNWLSKLQNLEDAINIKNIEIQTVALIKLFLFDLNNSIFTSNKNFFVEIFKTLFSIISINSDAQKMKSFYNSVRSEIKTCLMNVRMNLNLNLNSNVNSNLNFSNCQIDFNKFKDFLIVLEAIASSEAQISKTTSELCDYFEILNFLLNFLNFDLDLNLEKENRYSLFSEKLKFLSSLVTTFCKISSKFINETFKKEEMLKYVNSSLNKKYFTNEDKFQLRESDIRAYYELNQPFFNTDIFTSIVKKILNLNLNLNCVEVSDEEIHRTFLFIPLNFLNIPISQIIELNLQKSHIIDLISNITDYLNINNIFDNFEIFKNLSKILTIESIKGLSAFYKNSNKNETTSQGFHIDEKSENTKEEIMMLKCIVRILEFLINVVQTSVGGNIFSENKIEIFRYIILPNLKTTQLERELFLIEPEEFMNSLYDMSSKQMAKSPKVKSLKLVDVMSEYIDSFLRFITEFYTDIIHYVIYKQRVDSGSDSNLSQIFSIISQEKIQAIFSDYIQSLTDEDLLEQSLQVLSSVSYLIYDRINIRTFFEDKFDHLNHILIEIKDEFIKAKLCNFYAFNLDDMFHDNNQVFSKSFDDAMNFLIKCLLSENKNISLNFIALDSINSIIFDESMKVIVTDFVRINFRAILNMVNFPYFNNLTGNPMFYKTVKNLIALFFNEIENDIFYVFQFFWIGVQKEFEIIIIRNKKNLDSERSNMIKFSDGNLEDLTEKKNILKEKNFNFLEKLHSLISLLQTCIQRSHIVENKSMIFNEVLKLLQYLDSFVNYEYEEEILEMIQVILNDLKLVPSVYVGCLIPLLEKFASGDSKKFKFEEYHINFIFNFMKNLRMENFLEYKEKIFNLISSRLTLSSVNQYEVCKNEKENLSIMNLLIVYIIFYWDYLTISNIYNDDSNDDSNRIINILKLRFTKRSIVNEELITRILLTFFLIIIKLTSVNENFIIKNFKSLEIFLIKSISFSGRGESIEENSISSIFASKMIVLLVTQNQQILTNFNDSYKDNTIVNYIKHLINFNIDNLLFLKKEAGNISHQKKREIHKSDSGNNLYTDNLITNELNIEDENNFKNKLKKENLKSLIKEGSKNRKKIENLHMHSLRKNRGKKINQRQKNIKEFEFELDEISQDNSDYEDFADSSLSNYGDNEDLVDEIPNVEEEEFVDENDDRDEEFLKVKNSHKNEILSFIENFSPISFKNIIRNVNEFKIFDSVLNFVQQLNPLFYSHILSSFTKTKLKLLESIRHFQKISDVEGCMNFRKIVKIKRK